MEIQIIVCDSSFMSILPFLTQAALATCLPHYRGNVNVLTIHLTNGFVRVVFRFCNHRPHWKGVCRFVAQDCKCCQCHCLSLRTVFCLFTLWMKRNNFGIYICHMGIPRGTESYLEWILSVSLQPFLCMLGHCVVARYYVGFYVCLGTLLFYIDRSKAITTTVYTSVCKIPVVNL